MRVNICTAYLSVAMGKAPVSLYGAVIAITAICHQVEDFLNPLFLSHYWKLISGAVWRFVRLMTSLESLNFPSRRREERPLPKLSASFTWQCKESRPRLAKTFPMTSECFRAQTLTDWPSSRWVVMLGIFSASGNDTIRSMWRTFLKWSDQLDFTAWSAAQWSKTILLPVECHSFFIFCPPLRAAD